MSLTRFSCIKRLIFRMLSFLVVLPLLWGCMTYKKVPVTYRRLPIIQNLDQKKLVIGVFYQKSDNFQAVTDFVRIAQRMFEKEKVFQEVEYVFDVRSVPEEHLGIEESMATLKTMDWVKHYPDSDADLFLVGAISYRARDRSGYDSEWRTNRYGYRVPQKVYRERLAFSLELGLILVDAQSGEVVFDKTYTDEDSVEGAADEIGVFFDLIDKRLMDFTDEVQGKKIKAKRFLLYK